MNTTYRNTLIGMATALAAMGAYAQPGDTAAPAPETTADQPAPAAETPQIAACAKLLQQAAAALDAVQKPEDTDQAAEALAAAFDATDKLVAEDAPKPTEADVQAMRSALKAVAEAWWQCESRTDDPDISFAPALVYQLYIRRTPITDIMLAENEAMEGMLCMPDMEEASADLKREQEAWLAALQAKHDAVDKAVYGGGRGSSEEDAITLLPYLGKDTDEETTRKVICDYLRAVFGKDADACFMGVMATPGGEFYHIAAMYKGTFRDSADKVQLRVLPVYFRVK